MAQTMGMSKPRWQLIQEIFEQASALSADERVAWVHERCGEDVALRDLVLGLLEQSAGSDSGLGQSVDQAIAGAPIVDDVQPGQLVGRYRVLRTLGRGGMAAVYLAERADEQFRQQVAVKLIDGRLPGEALARRFRAERQILANLNHPNIARLLDGGTTEKGVPYLVMEYVDGSRLDVYCDRKHLARRRSGCELFQQVCARRAVRASEPGRPPRHQAVQHPGHGRRHAQAARLRHREAPRHATNRRAGRPDPAARATLDPGLCEP